MILLSSTSIATISQLERLNSKLNYSKLVIRKGLVLSLTCLKKRWKTRLYQKVTKISRKITGLSTPLTIFSQECSNSKTRKLLALRESFLVWRLTFLPGLKIWWGSRWGKTLCFTAGGSEFTKYCSLRQSNSTTTAWPGLPLTLCLSSQSGASCSCALKKPNFGMGCLSERFGYKFLY